DHELPVTVCLFLPDGRKVTKANRLLIVNVSFEFPRSKGVAHVSRRCHVRKNWLPSQERPTLGYGHWMFQHPLLSHDCSRPEKNSVVRYEHQERIARALVG